MFEIAKTASGYASAPTTLASFDGSTSGPVIADANGDLFGTTPDGGANDEGTVFEIAKTATGYTSAPTTLVSFNVAGDGAGGGVGPGPQGNLIADANGDLFGTTAGGGANEDGTVFEIAKTATGYASAPTMLASFDGPDGEFPVGSLIADANGDLFGTTEAGGLSSASAFSDGTVFEIKKTAAGYASTPTTLASFNIYLGPVGPEGSLIADANGDLFGVTYGGGNVDRVSAAGTVFEIAKTAAGYDSTPITLATFTGPNGAEPVGGLILDAAGDLFGTTSEGGASGLYGTAFEIKKTPTGYASAPSTLISFDGADGAGPEASLIADANGDLFGTTGGGGANGSYGTVFEITDSGFIVSSSGRPPTITGTVADRTTTSEAPIDPFSTVTIGDPSAGATDTLSITFAAADGSLSGAGLGGSNGSDTLSGTAAAITTELDALSFKPVDGVPNTSVTTTFTLSDTSSAYPTPTVDHTTSVIDSDPAVPRTIATNGVTTLAQVGNQYALESGGSIQAWVEYQGSPVTAVSGATWAPVGAVETGNGYEVAWRDASANEYAVWNTDLSGDYTTSATGVPTGSSQELEAVEGYFGEHFAGAGTPATPQTPTNGITPIGNLFELNPGGGTGPLLQYQGSFDTASPSAVWAPVAALKTGNGYEVAWRDASANEYTVWNTDLSGDYTTSATGVLTGSSQELEAVEGYFGEQFAGAGTPATPQTPTNGITPIGNLFELNPGGGTGPLLRYQGSFFTASPSAVWAPVAALKTGNGYEVAWRDASANEYTVWNTDLSGDYTTSATGVLTGSSQELKAVEGYFGEQFADAGTPATPQTPTNGITPIGNLFELNPGGGTGPLLQYQGSLVTAGGVPNPGKELQSLAGNCRLLRAVCKQIAAFGSFLERNGTGGRAPIIRAGTRRAAG